MDKTDLLNQIESAMNDLRLLKDVVVTDSSSSSISWDSPPIRGSKSLINRTRQQVNLKLTVLSDSFDNYTYRYMVEKERAANKKLKQEKRSRS